MEQSQRIDSRELKPTTAMDDLIMGGIDSPIPARNADGRKEHLIEGR